MSLAGHFGFLCLPRFGNSQNSGTRGNEADLADLAQAPGSGTGTDERVVLAAMDPHGGGQNGCGRTVHALVMEQAAVAARRASPELWLGVVSRVGPGTGVLSWGGGVSTCGILRQ